MTSGALPSADQGNQSACAQAGSTLSKLLCTGAHAYGTTRATSRTARSPYWPSASSAYSALASLTVTALPTHFKNACLMRIAAADLRACKYRTPPAVRRPEQGVQLNTFESRACIAAVGWTLPPEVAPQLQQYHNECAWCARAGLGWRREDPGQWRGVNPIPFHASNILLHALVTCLVFKCAPLGCWCMPVSAARCPKCVRKVLKAMAHYSAVPCRVTSDTSAPAI